MKHWLLFATVLLGICSSAHAQKHVDANAYTQHPAEYNNQVVKISNIILIKPSSRDEWYAIQFRECPKGYNPIAIQFPDLGYRGRFMIHQNLAGTFVENQHIIADVVIEVNLNGPSMFSVVTYVEPHR
ncbi:MAG: hypothetical protein O3C22_07400 [Bacteroidetes bacterium]|nr:hypothetical protein [Bacteroidota bacterium]MDA0944019.1 hypothetical protein [Bacteroidota bacterium]MDA1112389.1 hypothetical protein [Bacteroidota bacterium]